MLRSRILVTILALFTFGVMIPDLFGWEIDVHLVLTRWLAEKAGFSRADADDIARGDQGLDDSDHHAAIQNVFWIILYGNRDLGTAQDLEDHHFPNGSKLPSPPQLRVVTPGDQWAHAAIDSAIQTGPHQLSLRKVGEGLHALQDSWAHQGVPDIPFGLRPNLVSAHPAARGGWLSHNADLTHVYPQDAIDAARATYEALLKFLKEHPRFRDHRAEPWTNVEPLVEQFARAPTQDAKDQWAVRANASLSQGQMASTTLRGHRSAGRRMWSNR